MIVRVTDTYSLASCVVRDGSLWTRLSLALTNKYSLSISSSVSTTTFVLEPVREKGADHMINIGGDCLWNKHHSQCTG